MTEKNYPKNSPGSEISLPKGRYGISSFPAYRCSAAAIVQKGDHVLAGQKIADAAGFVSSPIHSSVSGTVKGIEPRPDSNRFYGQFIIIENDQQYESVEFTCTSGRSFEREDFGEN